MYSIDMQQAQQTQMGDGLSVEQTKSFVESIVYERDGQKFLRMGNYALDFKQEYLYLGMTKSGKAILGDVYSWGPNNKVVEYRKRFGNVEVRESHKVDGSVVKQVRMWTDGYRYSETLGELQN